LQLDRLFARGLLGVLTCQEVVDFHTLIVDELGEIVDRLLGGATRLRIRRLAHILSQPGNARLRVRAPRDRHDRRRSTRV
jgi:hypothetical protein